MNAQKYEIVNQIGEGGMAQVLLAVPAGASPDPQQRVALKRLHPHMRGNAIALGLFVQEARFAGVIEHPNCLLARDACDLDGALHIVMDYVPGVSAKDLLRHYTRQRAPIPLGLSARILLDLLAGLDAVHSAADSEGCLGIVHQDLSLHNLLLGHDGICRITDFGAAKVHAWRTQRVAGVVVGTLGYAAPERFTHHDVSDQRSDIYAMGVVMWELLTGRRLVNDRLATRALVEQVRKGIVQRPGAVALVPHSLEDVCMRALERNPEARHQSATEFRTALLWALQAAGTPAWDSVGIQEVVQSIKAATQSASVRALPGAGRAKQAERSKLSSELRAIGRQDEQPLPVFGNSRAG